MRILLCSTWFSPNVGGVETVSKLLAEEFTRAGATVTVVTSTPGPQQSEPYVVLRNPSAGALRAAARQCDIVFQNMISLRMLLPILGLGKPLVITHQSWMRRNDGSRGWENYLKMFAARGRTNVSISKAIADSLPVPSIKIPNPFESTEFGNVRNSVRDRDIVFMGRLVSDKGCDLLIRALAELKTEGLKPTVTIIGKGPELPRLQQLCADLQLADRVVFPGALGKGRGELVARHRIMAIPSIWAEPFGVVALEGIAAGCAIVASERGGLPDAVGPCGLYFPNGDASALADRLRILLTDDAIRSDLVAKGPAHIAEFQPDRIAARYLELFRSLL